MKGAKKEEVKDAKAFCKFAGQLLLANTIRHCNGFGTKMAKTPLCADRLKKYPTRREIHELCPKAHCIENYLYSSMLK
ncbi:MAG: hypothetical protein J7J28_03520 [Thaumarchaeota archaeon]|nr:hypothetical protein [Nitrososphaerota archaeon]